MKKLTGLIIANIFILAVVFLFMSNFLRDCEYEEKIKPLGTINFIFYDKNTVIGTDIGYKLSTTGKLYKKGDRLWLKMKTGNCEDVT